MIATFPVSARAAIPSSFCLWFRPPFGTGAERVPPAMQALYRDVAVLGGPVGNARHGWSLTRVALLRDAATQHVCCH